MPHKDAQIASRSRKEAAENPVVLHVLGCKSLQYGMFEDNLVAITGVCKDRGFSSWFVYPNEPVASMVADIEANGGRVLVAPNTDDGSWRGAMAINSVIRRVKPAAVHAHFGRPSYLAVVAARAAGVPRIVATKHHESYPALSRPHALALRAVAGMADELLCVSEIVRDEALAAGVPASKLRVTLFGVNTERFGPPSAEAAASVREEFGVPEGAAIVLCASHLRIPKGMDVLLSAWDRLGPSADQALLIIAGDGPLKSELEAQAAESSSASTIRFLGIRQDMTKLMAGCDVFVCPSLSEAGGFVVMEALGAGIPTVSTLVGMARSIADMGLYVPARPTGDVLALSEALDQVLSDPQARIEMAKRARTYVCQTRSLEASARLLADVYELPIHRAAESEVLA